MSRSLLVTIEPFLTELWPLDLENSNYWQFSIIFLAEVAHTEMKFGK
jgi:hypothetical protein